MERGRWRQLTTGRDTELARLAASLDQDPRTAARGAVLLGLIARDLPPESEESRAICKALMARLEERIAPQQGETGVDLVAARVLGELITRGAASDEALGLLVELASEPIRTRTSRRASPAPRQRSARPATTAAWFRSCSPSCARRRRIKT